MPDDLTIHQLKEQIRRLDKDKQDLEIKLAHLENRRPNIFRMPYACPACKTRFLHQTDRCPVCQEWIGKEVSKRLPSQSPKPKSGEE